MILLSETTKIGSGLRWHLNRQIPLRDNVYRYGSDNYFKLIREARGLANRGELLLTNPVDRWIINSNIGELGIYEGLVVILEVPMLIESEYKGRDVELNKPMRSSGPKKYKVYVKNDKGNVIQINFGDVKGGLTTKINDPEARKAFADRHNCKDKKDKTTAGYWSCNLPRYRKNLGMGKNLNTYW